MQLIFDLKSFLDYSLMEDLGVGGDITSEAVIDKNQNIDFQIITREDMILCGEEIIKYYLDSNNIRYKLNYHDKQFINKGDVLAYGSGNAHIIFSLERTILNFIQHLSGVATLTNSYVRAVEGSKIKICDTRKTIPGMRKLQKYAVRCGGGFNHRLGIDSSILIKDNHLTICKNMQEAILRAKAAAPHYTKIEVECDNISQVQQAVELGVDIIMLDNMNLTELEQAVKLINHRALIDVSGRINLNNIGEIRNLAIDFISIGRLTHSSRAIDIGLDINNG